MEEELNLDDLEVQAEEKLKVKNRFEKLSEKVILTSKERDEALAKIQVEADAKAQAEKERDFYKDFSSNVSKYPQAAEYQGTIMDKVKSGYSTEDAILAVLAKEGKLSPSEAPKERPSQIEGGSAPTNFAGDKTLQDMSADEKLSALSDLDKSGALAQALRGR